ncbi:hypothetical protein FQA47_004141 [Oryzias melastigma]|uniref:Uncharacterized protein n=1 Tax=Oryzias melastigma TaxID=30732 RepID=A0A834CQQ4_ORYME|nr:hypothetical protein FQA47_004141 [Oryzias melastigma]
MDHEQEHVDNSADEEQSRWSRMQTQTNADADQCRRRTAQTQNSADRDQPRRRTAQTENRADGAECRRRPMQTQNSADRDQSRRRMYVEKSDSLCVGGANLTSFTCAAVRRSGTSAAEMFRYDHLCSILTTDGAELTLRSDRAREGFGRSSGPGVVAGLGVPEQNEFHRPARLFGVTSPAGTGVGRGGGGTAEAHRRWGVNHGGTLELGDPVESPDGPPEGGGGGPVCRDGTGENGEFYRKNGDGRREGGAEAGRGPGRAAGVCVGDPGRPQGGGQQGSGDDIHEGVCWTAEGRGLHPDSGAEIWSAVTSCPERKFPQAAVDAVDIPSS